MVLSYTLQAPQFAQEMGPLLTVRPHVLGQESFPVDHHPRKLPIDLGRTREVHDDFTSALPALKQHTAARRALLAQYLP